MYSHNWHLLLLYSPPLAQMPSPALLNWPNFIFCLALSQNRGPPAGERCEMLCVPLQWDKAPEYQVCKYFTEQVMY